MKVKIKKLNPSATVPKYSKSGDAALDLFAVDLDYDDFHITYKTGLAIEIPENHVGLLFPRSSVYKTRQVLANSVGVIDSGYRGEIMLKYTRSEDALEYNAGDRVGQILILPYPSIDFIETDTLSSTDRDSGGFGSTGT